jgi:CBS domain containing-hemolysin-like protein
MSRQSSEPAARPNSGTRPIWAVVALLLIVGTLVPLLVGTYDSEKPTLFGFPFFYWFQFLLIPIVSSLTYIAFKLSQAGTERDRRARGIGRRQP